jgi:hypothetical protein
MAIETRTSRARTSRKARNAAGVRASSRSDGTTEPLEELQEAIEAGRERLMTAESLLHCVTLAMSEGECGGAQEPDYQTLVALGRALVKESIDRLDSVRLKPLLLKLCAHGRDEVKEERGVYLH